ncbi:MAG: AAA family ATPase, partial [bacterium]|nr:AAA family ATPase [bacterium]
MKKFYFSNKYLELSGLERFIFRLLSYALYLGSLSLALVFFLSDSQFLNAIAILLLLFLVDRTAQVGKAKSTLKQIVEKTAFQIVEEKKGAKNISDFLNPKSLKLLEAAQTRTLLLGGDLQIHLFLLLLRQGKIQRSFTRLEIRPEKIIAKAEEHLNKFKRYKPKQSETLRAIETVVKEAFQHSLAHYDKDIGPEDLMAALGSVKNTSIERIYALFDIEAKDLENALILSRRKVKNKKAFFAKTHKIREKRMNRAWTARPTPTLDQFSTDITDIIRGQNEGFLIGHAQTYDRLIDVLSRGTNANTILIGEPGVGKETIIYHLAFQISKDRVPKALFDKRLVALDIGALASSATSGELEERITRIVNEIRLAGNIILYIPEIHDLLKTSGEMHLSGADVLLPALKDASFSVIGATYPKEYAHYVEEDSNFKQSFEAIRVEEISQEEAMRYLSYQSLMIESSSDIVISFSAVKKAVEIAHKYFHQTPLPSNAENLLKESVADALEKSKRSLTASDVLDVAEKRINVPLRTSSKEEGNALLKLEEKIHETFIDQNEAVKAVSSALREYRSGLSRSSGPIASFLFVGPTGVGKTELSKILSRIHFGSEDNMKRFDM